MYETLEIEIELQVSTVWMNRPAVHNAFNARMIAELTTALQTLGQDPGVRVIVLAGRGKCFSAGADLNSMKSAGSATFDENLKDARLLAQMLCTLSQIHKPTLARVHGAALGGGLGLAAACDICIASTTAFFATSEVRFGIMPSTISPYVIRAIGARNAYRYFQTAERITATQAREIGLAHETASPETLDEVIRELVSALLLGSPQAQAASKDLIRYQSTLSEALVEETARRIATLRATEEAREGLEAFLEKRPANWVQQGINHV